LRRWIEKTVQRDFCDHRVHVGELHRPIGLIVRAAGRLLLSDVAAIRPLHSREFGRAGAPDVTLQAAPPLADGDGVASAGMRLGPPVDNGLSAPLPDMPAIERALGDPVSGRSDDHIGRCEQILVVRDQLMQAASTMFDVQMRKVGLQAFDQGFGLVAPYRGGAERMAPYVGSGQPLWIDQDEAADARLGQRAGDRRPD